MGGAKLCQPMIEIKICAWRSERKAPALRGPGALPSRKAGALRCDVTDRLPRLMRQWRSLNFEVGISALSLGDMFRPCIDLHEGKVKQIVGGTFGLGAARLKTNYVSDRPAAWFAELYKRDELRGGHVIMLGPGNEAAARSA